MASEGAFAHIAQDVGRNLRNHRTCKADVVHTTGILPIVHESRGDIGRMLILCGSDPGVDVSMGGSQISDILFPIAVVVIQNDIVADKGGRCQVHGITSA